jgi:hypothetical protein
LKRIHIYFREPPQKDRFIPGDRYLFSAIKKLIRRKRSSGLKKVFLNLSRGFDTLKVDYDINLPFKKIQQGEPVIVLGEGRYALEGYDRPNKVIAGIGLMTHPNEWPDLFEQYPVAKYLQHSEWATNMYAKTYGTDKCAVWPAGIDTEKWQGNVQADKKFDLLVYSKIMWNKQQTDKELRLPILEKLQQLGLSFNEITYGHYQETDYYNLLQQSKAMIFLCEHESQGFALCEALSMNVPVFAWNQGFWLDPNLIAWGEPNPVPASSIPFFDDRCGMQFKDLTNFEALFDAFWNKVKSGDFNPREYILENLTLEKSARRMLEIVESVYK